jgi:hypothetical protein
MTVSGVPWCRVVSILRNCSAPASQTVPQAAGPEFGARDGESDHEQFSAQPVDDQLLSAAERCRHVGCIDVELHPQISYAPRQDLRVEPTQESLFVAGRAPLEPQQHHHGERAHRRNLALHCPARVVGQRSVLRHCLRSHRARWWLFALGPLHVLAGPSLTGSGAGSRAEEAQKSGRWVQDPSARLGLLRRALEAAPEPVTLPGRREGARPPFRSGA